MNMNILSSVFVFMRNKLFYNTRQFRIALNPIDIDLKNSSMKNYGNTQNTLAPR